MSLDIAEIRKRKRPATRKVSILLAPDLRLRYDELSREIEKAEKLDRLSNEADRAPALVREREALEDEIEESTVEFVLRALPRADWMTLLEAHPPTDEDKEDGLDYNPEGVFAPLLAACAVEPEMELSDAEAIYEEWSQAEVTQLFVAAIRVNREVRNVPLGRARSGEPDTSTERN